MNTTLKGDATTVFDDQRVARFPAKRAKTSLRSSAGKQILFLALLAVALPLASTGAASSERFLGVWGGHYVCQQGRTAVTIDFQSNESGQGKAIFSFGGQKVPRGRFEQKMRYSPRTRALSLDPHRWLRRPQGYQMVGVRGTFSRDLRSFDGRITLRGCGQIKLTRIRGNFPPTVASRSGTSVARNNRQGTVVQNRASGTSGVFRGVDLGGTWAHFSVFFKKSTLSRGPFMRLNLRPYFFRFGNAGGRSISVSRYDLNGKPTGTDRLKIPRDRTLLFAYPEKGKSVFPPLSGKPVRDQNGVSLLMGRAGYYLLRFAPIPGLDSGSPGAGPLPHTFCPMALGAFAPVLKREIALAEQLAGYRKAVSRYDVQRAAGIALSTSDAFGKVFGAQAGTLSKERYLKVVERLKYCSILFWDSADAELLATALFGAKPSKTVKGFLKTRSKSFKDPTISLRLRADDASEIFSSFHKNKEAFRREVASIKTLSDDATIQARRKALIRKYQGSMPPSWLKPVAEALERQIESADRRLAVTQREERLRTAPTPTTDELVFEATRKYFLRNCNRAFFAVRNARKNNDEGVFASFAAQSIEASDGKCQTNMGPQILSLGVLGISNVGCTSGRVKECRFTLRWTCSLQINPAFGFTADVRNFDPICPIIRRAPVKMVGLFSEIDRLTWSASKIEF